MRFASLQKSLFGAPLSRKQLWMMILLFVAVLGAARLGSFLFTMPAVIQPAAGVALAGLVIGGLSLWPAVVAAFAAQVVISGAPPIVALFAISAHTLHAVFGAYVLNYFKFDPVFRRIRDMFVFMLIALSVSMIVPSIGMLGILLNNLVVDPDWPFRTTWISWWVGVMVGDLILASALVRWLAKPLYSRTWLEWAEVSAALVSLVVLTYFVVWTDASDRTNGIVVLFWLMPFIWFALRLGTRFTFLAFLLMTAIGITGVLYGPTVSEQPMSERIIGAEILFATLAVIFYLFTAVMEERKRAAREISKQLTTAKDLLHKLQIEGERKNEFLAIFSHELRNPLAPIVSSLELLKLRGMDKETDRIVTVIDERIKTMVRLLEDLLDVSRISQQTFKLKHEKFDVRTSVTHAQSALHDIAKEHGLTLESRVGAEAILLYADPIRVEQIIINLLMNAIKYTDRGGRITLTLTAEGGSARISVRDTGIGIDDDMRKRIFEPFSRLGAGRQRQRLIRTGIGIGLWLTDRLVRMHNGSIEVKSDGAGKGSEFIVSLPLAEEAKASALAPITLIGSSSTKVSNEGSMEIAPQKGALRILVVDDNEAAAHGLGTLLKHVGNTVEFAYVGKDVAHKVAEFSPDVIVLDIGLPDMTGYEVAQELRKGGFDKRIIALTGYGQEDDKKKAAEAGFDYHLTKPVGLADLQAVLMPQGA